MKKRLIRINWLILCIAVMLLLIISVIIVSHYNFNNSKRELRNYLAFASEIYDGDNAINVANAIKEMDKDVRITFIALDGTVIVDSSSDQEFDSHIDRPEILNLGTVYKRYSQSLGVDMIYVASRVGNEYVRVAMPVISINEVVREFVLYSLLALVLIAVLSYGIIIYGNKLMLKPLNKVVNQLSEVADDVSYHSDDDIESISYKIDHINRYIMQRISELIDEKDKVDFVLNNINQGIVVINSIGEIVLLNDYVASVFNNDKESVIHKQYIYLIRNIELQNQLQDTIDNGTQASLDVMIDSRIYLINISPSNNKWTLANNEKNGAALVLLDVTEQRNMEAMKREFFANASHELKSPLTTIIGYQQMIDEKLIQNKTELEDAVKRTMKEAVRMKKILTEMLQLSQLESLDKPSIERINLKSIVVDALDSQKKLLEDKKITVESDLQDCYIDINYNHATQLVNNLIDNAIKYNREGGMLSVATSEKMLMIADNGIGISPENQSRVFERFYRVDKGRSKELGGTGLGLAIVKHICSLYKAKIVLKSEINKGTKFTIQF